jgi:hypothetical protein
MKKILSISLLIASFFGAKAQKTAGDFNFGVGVHLGLPTGNLHTTSSFGIGGEVQGEYAFSENLTGVATSGYTSFTGKSYDFGFGVSGKYPALGQIPILVGARYYPAAQFFVGAQIGFGIWTGSGSSTSGFEYRPQIGYDLSPIQLSLHYDGTSVSGGSLGYVGLSALYTFGGSGK